MIPVIRSILLAALAVALGACGGGGSADSGGIGGTGVTSTGVMIKGSIVLNGVHYDDSSATNMSDDPLGSNSVLPDDGKVVKLKGRRNDDGVTGTAERFEVENEVRGTVQSTDDSVTPQSLTVVDQTVTIDDLTICSNFITSNPITKKCGDPLSELTAGSSFVEVHGLRFADGTIRASRVELLGATNPGGVDELRGTVNAFAGISFQLVNGGTSVTVNYAGTPALTNGQRVEVHGTFDGTEFNATRVDIEDLEDNELEPENNGEFEVEGFVSGCATNTPCGSSFFVGGRAVTMTTSRFENGDANDLLNGVRVEAEGHFVTSTGTLMADKIEFKRVRVELTGDATITGGGNLVKGGTLSVMGVTIHTDQTTSFDPRGGAITSGEPVEVRGYLDSSNQVLAVEVKELSSSGDETIRGPVTAKGTSNVTIVGITVNLASATQFQDGAIATLSQFMSLITAAPSPGGTVVKAKGTFSSGTLDASEAEIED